jgi:hypothetical protein
MSISFHSILSVLRSPQTAKTLCVRASDATVTRRFLRDRCAFETSQRILRADEERRQIERSNDELFV